LARHPRVLITGAGGQVGVALRSLIPDAVFLAHADLDVTDADAVSAALRGIDAVIHLAADTDVDGCEQDPARAHLVNDRGTAYVATAAHANHARVIYVSTDFVFSGTDEGEYSEDAKPHPVNAYGASKLAGEKHMDERDLVVRSSWIFGAGKNFIATILALGHDGPVRVVDDQRGRPTGAVDLATALVWLLDAEITGAVHVAGDGVPCTWADLAQFAFGCAGMDVDVQRIDTRTYEASVDGIVAPRPANSALALDKARALGVPLVDWHDSVTRYVGRDL
jgi:dTDP-4-dehydrorhamnose reductase